MSALWNGPRRGDGGARPHVWFAPDLEILEDRLAPATALDVSQQTYQLDAGELETVAAQASSFGATIGLESMRAANPQYQGQGYAVAIIDSGIDYNHPALAGRVILGWDFVNNDADPMDDNGHGTHLAGIVGSNDPTFGGVAPQVQLVALKVLDASGTGSFDQVEAALRWVINHAAQYNIAAVTLSLGSGAYTVNPYDLLEDELATLVGQGVFLAGAAGNYFYSSGSLPGLTYPAISPYIVSVGAVFGGDYGAVYWGGGAADYSSGVDRIVSMSQRGPALELLAPGAFITSTYVGGGFATMSGTSMAAPIVAGAAVLLRQVLVSVGRTDLVSPAYVLSVMQGTGVAVVDGDDEVDNVVNTGLSFRRLDIQAAMSAVIALGSPPPPVTGPAPPAPPAAPAPTPPAPVGTPYRYLAGLLGADVLGPAGSRVFGAGHAAVWLGPTNNDEPASWEGSAVFFWRFDGTDRWLE